MQQLKSKNDTAAPMAEPGKARSGQVKRCPECYTNIPMRSTQCPSCHQKIKTEADKHGYAKKPINWTAYATCFFAWAGLAVYIWWAFFRE